MWGIFKLKSWLLGVLVASPTVALWSLRAQQSADSAAFTAISSAVVSEPVVQIPVEVIADGSAPEWVYVEVGHEAIPEPGMISLLTLTTAIFVFRRRRK